MNAGIAMKRPEAVATSTSPMAPASWEGSPTPEEPSLSKAFIMPVTVPVRVAAAPASVDERSKSVANAARDVSMIPPDRCGLAI
mgnify:CR=1 FL=1